MGDSREVLALRAAMKRFDKKHGHRALTFKEKHKGHVKVAVARKQERTKQ